MTEPRRQAKTEVRRELQPLTTGHCYHCETKATTNVYCERWAAWACKNCLAQHHRLDHDDCKDTEQKGPTSDQSGPRLFSLSLTRYDGQAVSFMCQVGQKLEMEEHWLGTYVFFPSALVLVREDQQAINLKILKSLQGVA